jgi:hypothetical protein
VGEGRAWHRLAQPCLTSNTSSLSAGTACFTASMWHRNSAFARSGSASRSQPCRPLGPHHTVASSMSLKVWENQRKRGDSRRSSAATYQGMAIAVCACVCVCVGVCLWGL